MSVSLTHKNPTGVPYHVIVGRNSIFSENDLLTPVTPNDPKFKFEPTTFVGVSS